MECDLGNNLVLVYELPYFLKKEDNFFWAFDVTHNFVLKKGWFIFIKVEIFFLIE